MKSFGRTGTSRLARCQKRPRNVYAYSKEECETLLAELIAEMKVEIAAEKGWVRSAAKAGQAKRRTGA